MKRITIQTPQKYVKVKVVIRIKKRLNNSYYSLESKLQTVFVPTEAQGFNLSRYVTGRFKQVFSRLYLYHVSVINKYQQHPTFATSGLHSTLHSLQQCHFMQLLISWSNKILFYVYFYCEWHDFILKSKFAKL